MHVFNPVHFIRQRATHLLTGRQQVHHDQALADRLYQTFEHEFELVDVHGFHFYVQDSTVTVFGTAQHELDRDLLVALIRQVPGVDDVVSRLQIVEARFNTLGPTAPVSAA